MNLTVRSILPASSLFESDPASISPSSEWFDVGGDEPDDDWVANDCLPRVELKSIRVRMSVIRRTKLFGELSLLPNKCIIAFKL